MAEEQPTEAKKNETRLDFIGMDQVVALSADAFLVARAEDAFTILFFQNQIPEIRQGALGKGAKLDSKETKCIARITVSPSGFNKLLTSMAGTVGSKLVPGDDGEQ